MVSHVRRLLRAFRWKPARLTAIVLASVLLAGVAANFRLRRVSAQETLYNGIVLTPDFLQPKSPTQAFRQPTYLTSPPAVIPINVGRQLFVDDFLIEATNLQRTAHRPVLYSGNPVLSGGTGRDFSGLAFPYSDGVWYDPDSKLFKMWYDGGFGNNIAYAYSTDGKTWIKPNIPDATIPDSNLVLTIGGGRETTTVWRDALDPDPSRRYKTFVLFDIPLMHIQFSGDGIHWSDPLPNDMNTIIDRTTVFHNPFRNVWVESARQVTTLTATATMPAHQARVRNYGESRDLAHWTDPTNVFWTGPDESDPPYVAGGALPELYSLDAVAYESLLVGLFSWFHPGPTYQPYYGPGPNLVELGAGFSRDGFQWVRPTRGSGPNAFIPASNVDGTWNCCNTQSVGGGFLVVGDELWFYFSARTARKPATGNGSTGLATLRRDGFYSMDAAGYEGVLTTRPVTFTGSHLFVNTAASGGRVQAEALDTFGNVIAPFSRSNSWIITGDTTRSEITWSGGDLSTLANRPVKLRFYVTNASLYSFWVTPSPTGASYGYVAAGGPGLTGATDTVGGGVSTPPAPAPAPSAGLSVALVSPVNGSIVSGTVAITASASGPSAIAGVVFRIDGGNVGPELPSPPYRYDWNTVPWSNSAHTITAMARDASGNTATSSITVTTQNGLGAPLPPASGPSTEPSGTNLALGRIATQSSNAAPASNAVDGNTDGDFSHGSVSHTNLQSNAWWQVDLAVSAAINAITIWNRTDCCASRLSDYWVFASDTPFGPADTPTTLQSRANTWSSHQTTFPNPFTTITVNSRGRYVRVQLTGNDYLHLAEVQVFGTPPPISINVAPAAVFLAANQSQQFSAALGNAPAGAVNWSMSPSVGTLSGSGLYVAPATISFLLTLTITATSLADASKSASASATLLPALSTRAAGQGLRFIPVSPCRVADTRNPAGPFGGPALGAGSGRDFNISASGCGIPANAAAYSLNLTALPFAPLGFLSVWPSGQTQPSVSTLNSGDGRIKANAAIVPAGVNGAITVFASNPTHVIVDISGYFVPASGAQNLAFYPITPCRLADTRTGAGAFGGPALAANVARAFPLLSGPCGIPATAQAYALNITVVPGATLGFLSAWATGFPQPVSSTLNAPTGAITSNMAIVRAGIGGAITVIATNATDVIIDITGYFAPPGAGSLDFYTASPCRILDTRSAIAPFGGPAMGASQSRLVLVPWSACGIPPTAKAYSLNATVVPPAPLGFLTLWGSGGMPIASTLNSLDGTIVANAAFVPAGSYGAVTALATNPTHLILDINGYFQ